MSEFKHPMVSVFLAVYQQKDYIRDSVDSVLAQDYPNFEVIIGDDGSTDGTQEILKEYHAKHPKIITLILSPVNTGITANCNRIFQKCSGKYIAFQAGDDIWLPGKLSRQVAYMEKNPNCAICYHNLEQFDSETGNSIGLFNNNNTNIPRSGGMDTLVRFGCFNGAVSNMVRKSECPSQGFDVRIPIASDWLFWIETLSRSNREIHYINEKLARYRIHNSSTTNAYNKKIMDNFIDHLNSLNIIAMRHPKYINIIAKRRKEICRDIFVIGGSQYNGFVSYKYVIFRKLFKTIKRSIIRSLDNFNQLRLK